MKFMIRCDIEGVTGVTTYQQAEGTPFGQAMLMNDLNAVIEGLLATGDHEIVVYDEHTDGRNVVLDNLPEAVSVICGKPEYRSDWGGIDASYDAMLMVGFHARSGVAGALLPHSYSRKNLRITINEFEVGEIGMEAAIAGDCGVPVQLVVADSAGAAEAHALLPGVSTVAVKESLGETGASCHSVEVTSRQIAETACEIALTPPPVRPYRAGSYVWLEVVLNDGPYLTALRPLAEARMRGDHTVVFGGPSATAVWSAYWQLKLKVQAAMGSAQ